MIDIVKAPFDISFNKPAHTAKLILQFLQSSVAASFRPESMGTIQKERLINRFQYHAKRFLNQFIRKRRNTQRAFLFGIVFLCNIHSSYRRRLIGLVCQRLNDSFNFGFAETICRILVDTLCSCTLILIQTLIGLIVNIRAQQIAIQSCKYFFLMGQ